MTSRCWEGDFLIYTDLTKKAMRTHKDQAEKSDLPYIFHPFHLTVQMTDEVSACAALMHDVVEDSPLLFDDLVSQDFPVTIINVLKLLTHDSNAPYTDYVQSVKDSGNQTAIDVKLTDPHHNSDTSRFDSIDYKAVARINKYKDAIEIL